MHTLLLYNLICPLSFCRLKLSMRERGKRLVIHLHKTKEHLFLYYFKGSWPECRPFLKPDLYGIRKITVFYNISSWLLGHCQKVLSDHFTFLCCTQLTYARFASHCSKFPKNVLIDFVEQWIEQKTDLHFIDNGKQNLKGGCSHSYSSGLHFSIFQDRSEKGALICSKICLKNI